MGPWFGLQLKRMPVGVGLPRLREWERSVVDIASGKDGGRDAVAAGRNNFRHIGGGSRDWFLNSVCECLFCMS